MPSIPTVAVKHPHDPSVRILVNESDADAYEAWEEPMAKQAPAAEGGDPKSEAKDDTGAAGDGPPMSNPHAGRSAGSRRQRK